MPIIVGEFHFQQAVQDGENYYIGWVDVTDRPYKELTNAAKETFKRLLDIHSGKESPTNRQAKMQ